MFFVFIFIQLVACSVGISNQKYSFVYLLDIGKLDLENPYSEQIKIEAPGGSIAVKYPATNNVDVINHVRVLGKDSVDLKAEVVEGGPGATYVVLLIKGEKDVPFNVVVDIQTINNDIDEVQTEDLNDDYDENDNVNKDFVNRNQINQNKELINRNYVDENNNIYNYVPKAFDNQNIHQPDQNLARNLVYDDYENNVSSEDISNDEGDKPKLSSVQALGLAQSGIYDKGYIQPLGLAQSGIYDKGYIQPLGLAQSSSYDKGYIQPLPYRSDVDISGGINRNNQNVVDKNLYLKFDALKPHFYYNKDVLVKEDGQETPFISEDPVEHMFNDEEVHIDGNNVKKYKGKTKENIVDLDADDISAVES